MENVHLAVHPPFPCSPSMGRSPGDPGRFRERPDRVIVDLPEVTFHLPAETGRRKEGLIASYRYGLFAPGRSRVVMDLAQPAVVSGIRVEPGAPGGATILV